MMTSVLDVQGLPSCVCNQCKRRKKKCDKRLPVCGRCSRLRIHCLYVPESKEASELSTSSDNIEKGKGFPLQGQVLSGPTTTAVPLPELVSPFAFITSVPGYFTGPSLFRGELQLLDFDEQLTLQACEILARIGDDLSSVCERYFYVTDKWLPIIDRNEFFVRLGRIQTSPSASFSTLALSMCLVAQASSAGPKKNVMVETIYFTSKCFWSLLQSSGRLSLELLQAGLLITAYEYSQSLSEASALSIGICARIGYALGLHRMIQPGAEWKDISKQDLEERRRAWWAVFILERMMAVESVKSRIPFACQTPRVDYQLPSDNIRKDKGNTAVQPSDIYTPISFELNSPTSTRLGPYPQEAQAAYLLDQVLDHITNNILDERTRTHQAEELDNSLQTLLMAMLEPLSGYAKGDYCGAYSICISALLSLHLSRLLPEESFWSTPTNDSSSRSLLALEAASRMLLEATASSVIGQPLDWDTLAPWSISTLYTAGLVRIKLSHGFPNAKQGELELSPAWTYLQHFESRYQIADHRTHLEKVLASYND